MTKIEDDTPIIPRAVAESVVEEVQVATDFMILPEMSRTFVDLLALRAQQTYEHNDVFRKKIRGRGNKGRDTLYAFMRHWLAAVFKKNYPTFLKKLPDGWGWSS